MALSSTGTARGLLSGLARKLVLDGLLAEEQATNAFREAQTQRIPLVSYLVRNNILNAKDLAQVASAEFGVPLLDVQALEPDPQVVKLVSADLIRKHHALPLFKRGNRLFVGVADPTNIQGLDEIKFATGTTTEPILVEEDKLSKFIEHSLDAAEKAMAEIGASDGLEDLENLEVGPDIKDESKDTEIDDAPVVKFVNRMLLDAIKKGASDLHFEPYEKIYRVRFRIDGILSEIMKPPVALSNKIAARIKVMSRLDVSERRVPQDGRIKLKVSATKAIDFRVSTCPTLWGEKAVMRILDSDVTRLGIDQLGYEEFQKEIFLENLHKPYGMFLVTGPTGSGKTVSLYTGINILNKAEINICTAEDPVEIQLPGVNQVQIEERTGMTFAKALRSFLRQDPDVILVGEIRDLETGSIAVKAAQTGHMVLSTLHTNDAPQTITRLLDMGVPSFAVATSLNVIIAQRLARRLCTNCKKPVDMPKLGLLEAGFTEEDIADGIKLHGAVGCEACTNGYKGRVGIYQVMPISDAIRRLIMENANAHALGDQADKEGVWTIRKSALNKVKLGMTSLEEINRVTLE
jgi:type IV pilus assembly protein PilB